MEPREPAANHAQDGGAFPSPPRPPRTMRVALWQGIAGMALMASLAAAIVTAEFAIALARRGYYVNRRVASLNKEIRTLKREATATERKLGSARERASAGETFGKILFAADLRKVRLAAPADKAGAATDYRDASGVLAMSESANAAMLEASGLRPSGEPKVYRIWWVPRRGAWTWAGDFIVGEDGRALVAVDPPAAKLNPVAIAITLENEAYADSPGGPLALRGKMTR